MKTIDVVKLALAGKSTEEIRELAALQEELDNNEVIAPDPEPEEVPEPEETPEPEENKELESLKKELEDVKSKLVEAQKANTRNDISGKDHDGPTDQDRVNDWVSSFM